jgi:hypothetical protein
MSNANATNRRIATEIEVRPGFWVRGNDYRIIQDARMCLDGVCNWRVLIEG